jgi:hypothetical protein
MTSSRLRVPVAGLGARRHLGVRIVADHNVPAGLYDDFLVIGLDLVSTTHYADLGFRTA